MGLIGWVLVVVVAWVVAKLAKARDVVRVVVWSFVGLNVLVYLPAVILIRPKTVAAQVTLERTVAQAGRAAKSLEKLEQELTAAKATPGAHPARFVAAESLIVKARSTLVSVGQEKFAKQAYEKLQEANKLVFEARRQLRVAARQPGIAR
jgi:hypothetical protein